MLERVWNERTSAGRPPDLNHDASDYDMDTIDRVHLSHQTPDPVHSSSRQAEMNTLQSATESSRAVTAVLNEVGSSYEPGARIGDCRGRFRNPMIQAPRIQAPGIENS